MSLAHFEQRLPAGPEVKWHIDRSKQTVESPIAAICRILTEETAMELRELLEKKSDESTVIQPTDLPRLDLPEEARNRVWLDYTGIVFGTAGVTIIDTLITGAFSLDFYASVYNRAVNHTMLSPFPTEGNPALKATSVNLKEMYAQIREDATLCSFFETRSGLRALPYAIGWFLEQTQTLPAIQACIIPVYKARAQHLIPAPNGVK